MTYKYCKLHIPTKQVFPGEVYFLTETEFLKHLDRWNRLGQGTWQYWSEA